MPTASRRYRSSKISNDNQCAHIINEEGNKEGKRERGGGAWSCYHWTKLNRDRLAANEAVWRSVSGKTSL